MHPFVALMRTYVIDYTNSHDQSLYDEFMEPGYVIHMMGFTLVRDESYAPAVTRIFDEYPGLGLVVHEFVLNGDRLCMRFSEHGASLRHDRRMAAWRGIGLYKWNGRRLTENYVEQDYHGRQRQLTTGVSDPLEPPHVDPWVGTDPVAEDASAVDAARAWLLAGDLTAAPSVIVDDSDITGSVDPVIKAEEVAINDLFSAGRRVAFHVTLHGPRLAGRADGPAAVEAADLHVAGVADVLAGGQVDNVRAVTSRVAVTGWPPA